LVPDQNWSRERFGNSARYFKNVGVSPANLEALKKFYADCPDLPAPTVKQYSWDDVATLLIGVYRRALNRP
ncbi:MAG TPA: hypothetical protein VFV81_04250, partial [Verrucomicrobiae bacterium]|nr:hypothetical protein [Verrucomicrobiae bacterium]